MTLSPYLVIGSGPGVTVPVIIGSGRYREESVPAQGVRASFSGVPRSSVRGYIRIWEAIETQWMSVSDEATLVAALKAAPPLTVTGRMAGSMSALVANIRRIDTARLMLGGTDTDSVRLSFDLWEIPA